MNTVFDAGQFRDKNFLVIGGGRGRAHVPGDSNGNATCLQLGACGANVIVADRDLAAAERTVRDLSRDSRGGQAWAMQVDVADLYGLPAFFQAVGESVAALDGVVINVGISYRTPLPQVEPEEWTKVITTNMSGHFFCAQHSLDLLAPSGSIVFVSSTASVRPGGRNPAYETSKAALSAICCAVALEGQKRLVRANIVMPGLIDTPMGRAATAARVARVNQTMPFGRQGTAAEVAAAIVFLLSNAASYVNAATLPVDGGLSAGITM